VPLATGANVAPTLMEKMEQEAAKVA
jgi:hypothetical protein